MHTHVALTLPYVPVVAGCDSPCSDSIVQLSEEGKTVHALGSFLVDPLLPLHLCDSVQM